MKWRICAVAVAVVVFLGAGHALADYLQLIVDINNATPSPKSLTAGNQGAPGQPGGAPPPGVAPGQGFPGGLPGAGFPGGKGKKGANQFRPPPQIAQPIMPIPGNPALATEVYREPLWAIVYLELKSKPDGTGAAAVKIDHQFGKTTYIPVLPWRDTDPPPFLQPEKIQRESLTSEFSKRFNKLKDTPKTKEMVDLAGWAWTHGIMKDFHIALDELKKQDTKHPVVTAYLKVQKQLKTQLTADDPAVKGILKEAKADGYRILSSDRGHYALLTNLAPGLDHDTPMKRRLTRWKTRWSPFITGLPFKKTCPSPPCRVIGSWASSLAIQRNSSRKAKAGARRPCSAMASRRAATIS